MDAAADTQAPPARSPRRWRRRLIRVASGVGVALALTVGALALSVDESPLDPGYGGPAPLPPKVAARFAYPEQGTPAQEIGDWGHEDHGSYSLRWLKLRVTTPGFEPHDVQVIHYRAHVSGQRPAIVITPILGGSGEVANLIAASLAREGIHAAIVWRAHSMLDSSEDESHLEIVLRTAIIDRRRTIDWLQGLDDVDPRAIGACGVSMGGIATTALLAAEPRIDAAVLALAGADIPVLLATSDQPRVRRYVRERGERGVDLPTLQARVRAAVPSEPLALARYVDARKVLFVAARRDTTVPYATQERLHDALGRPARITLPTGHYTTAIYLPYLLERIAAFFEEKLARPPRRDDGRPPR